MESSIVATLVNYSRMAVDRLFSAIPCFVHFMIALLLIKILNATLYIMGSLLASWGAICFNRIVSSLCERWPSGDTYAWGKLVNIALVSLLAFYELISGDCTILPKVVMFLYLEESYWMVEDFLLFWIDYYFSLLTSILKVFSILIVLLALHYWFWGFFVFK